MAETRKIRVLIVDDHLVVRQGLRTFLELNDDIEVVADAPNGKRGVELAAQLRPDVILMDLVMPEMDGITATRQISALGLGTRILALTSFAEDDQVVPAIQAGALGYLLKDISPDELVEAIRAANRGETRLHPDAARKLMERVAHPAPVSAMEELTGRELDVVRLVAQGKSNREIAETLFISEKTVKTHVSSILSKLNLVDRTQLAIYAIKNGMVEKE